LALAGLVKGKTIGIDATTLALVDRRVPRGLAWVPLTCGLRHCDAVSIPESLWRHAVPSLECAMERRRFRV